MHDAKPERTSAVALASAATGGPSMVVAKGYGAVAEAIIERAREHGLYVHASSDLVKLLMHVDLDSRVPPMLYVALGEMLSWLYVLEASRPNVKPLQEET